MKICVRILLLFILTVVMSQTWSYASTITFIHTNDADGYFYIDQNIKFEDRKTNYDGKPNFSRHVDDLQTNSTNGNLQIGTFFALMGGLSVAKSGADNIANASKLAKQLRLESARSPFKKSGRLTDDAIKNSREIIPSSEIRNSAIPKGFSKYSTETFQSPSGNFQSHFYKNSKTGKVFYDQDYKIIFNSK